VRAVHDLARRAGAVEPLDAGGLRTTASAVAVSAGVEILRLQPLDGGVVEFWFEGTEARKLFQWIAAMHQRYGTVVMKADLQRAAAGVGVDARIALQPAPGNE
ncbi:MAG: type II secretion system protein GspM, partial [Rhodospirillaceae bacterium]|nr:type II secretion system protein GspM [Rhodospirillaceae bacterium]